MNNEADFSQIIAADRETKNGEKWHRTFLDYLEQVKADPATLKTCPRAYIMIH